MLAPFGCLQLGERFDERDEPPAVVEELRRRALHEDDVARKGDDLVVGDGVVVAELVGERDEVLDARAQQPEGVLDVLEEVLLDLHVVSHGRLLEHKRLGGPDVLRLVQQSGDDPLLQRLRDGRDVLAVEWDVELPAVHDERDRDVGTVPEQRVHRALETVERLRLGVVRPPVDHLVRVLRDVAEPRPDLADHLCPVLRLHEAVLLLLHELVHHLPDVRRVGVDELLESLQVQRWRGLAHEDVREDDRDERRVHFDAPSLRHAVELGLEDGDVLPQDVDDLRHDDPYHDVVALRRRHFGEGLRAAETHRPKLRLASFLLHRHNLVFKRDKGGRDFGFYLCTRVCGKRHPRVVEQREVVTQVVHLLGKEQLNPIFADHYSRYRFSLFCLNAYKVNIM